MYPSSFWKLYIFDVFFSNRKRYRLIANNIMSSSCSVVSNSLRSHGLPGSSVHGIFQARILEWVASSSRRSYWPRNWTQVSLQADSLPSEPPGKSIANQILEFKIWQKNLLCYKYIINCLIAFYDIFWNKIWFLKSAKSVINIEYFDF